MHLLNKCLLLLVIANYISDLKHIASVLFVGYCLVITNTKANFVGQSLLFWILFAFSWREIDQIAVHVPLASSLALKTVISIAGYFTLPQLWNYGGKPDPFNLSLELHFIKKMIIPILKVKLFSLYQRVFKKSGSFVVDEWLATVQKHPTKEAIVMTQDRTLTFTELNKEMNQIASILQRKGVRPKETVSIILENSPEFIATWYALLKIGAECAFVNTNLQSESLEHALKISSGKVIVTHESLLVNLETIDYSDYDVYFFGENQFTPFTRIVLSEGSVQEPSPTLRANVLPNDPAIYVYTSGTTGMPKAAVISHTRLFTGCHVLSAIAGIHWKDRFYICLPLYHASASILGIGTMISYGTTIILSKKFSATHFTSHCKAYGVTGAQYIGEICRYLLNTPVDSEKDRDHSIRFMVGNGLGQDIWLEFKKRFGIPKIAEFYSSTEGNIGIFNIQENDNYGVGSVGRLGLLTGTMSKRTIIRIDHVTGVAVRDSSGNCIICKDNEPGEFVGQIKPGDPQADFKGYKGDPDKTEKKILRNVFKKGDMYFRSGDIVKRDRFGYIYFLDRIGDTFRWKGENVSTTEVSKAFTGLEGVEEANVYGVAVPKHDGRAGMASLGVNTDFDISSLYENLCYKLPAYAVPVFIRIASKPHITGTYKQIKTVLRDEGCSPSIVTDDLYVLQEKQYQKLTVEKYENLGTLKL
ncbi:hypothetical protein HK103_000630 [Boothiomyces macroporosus]|uniref:Very long-chain fatty acid transport protein n=1 Tax=Boothiomyces macroporosus TaxID=261099 RepID=A0AAD5Y5G5_9FUNG|nr:hypothetical protein HK103_000630 [Boothiomyces macroporosus]